MAQVGRSRLVRETTHRVVASSIGFGHCDGGDGEEVQVRLREVQQRGQYQRVRGRVVVVVVDAGALNRTPRSHERSRELDATRYLACQRYSRSRDGRRCCELFVLGSRVRSR